MADFSFVTARLATGAAVSGAADVQQLLGAGITYSIDCRLRRRDRPGDLGRRREMKKQAPRRGRARLACRVAQWPEPGATSRRTAAGSQPATPAQGALTPDADQLLPNTGDRTFVREWRQ